LFQPSAVEVEKRPSPVKFTSQCPHQFPIKPEPERPSANVSTEAVKHKMLSLENLKEALMPDYGREEVGSHLLALRR
jgi:hypothetical protein